MKHCCRSREDFKYSEWTHGSDTDISSSCNRIIILIHSWIDIEPVRVIRRNSQCFEPKCFYSPGSIHELSLCTIICSSSYDKWCISTIADKYLVRITIPYCSILCCHHIACPWSRCTSSRSFVCSTNIEFRTIIWISSNISY